MPQTRYKNTLAPLGWVATPGGVEATAHGITDLIRYHVASANIALLQKDLINVFNLINRHSILHEVHSHLPQTPALDGILIWA